MKIEILEKNYYDRYEKFLSTREESLLYYSIKYKNFLEELLSVKGEYLIAIDTNEEIHGVLPLMKKEGKYGTIINSLPFYGSNGGILASTQEVYSKLLERYCSLGKEVAGSTYITNPLGVWQETVEYDLIDTRIGQITFVGYKIDKKEQILDSYESSARRNINKAINAGVRVEIDNSQMDFLYKTHHENISSIGGKPKDRKFFELIDTFFEKGKDYNIYVADFNGEKIAALLLFYYNETVEYFMPATVCEYRSIQALPLVVYRAMCDCACLGYKQWNWGGTWLSQDGVYKFKKKFGAVDRRYKYYIKINNQEIYNSNAGELLSEYDNFYVIPFERLRN